MFIGTIIWSYLGTYQLSYYIWPFPLTQNWFADNGLLVFRDIIYHHTPLPLFILYYSSKLLGNTGEMLQFVSFVMTLFFAFGFYLLGKQISMKAARNSLILFLITFFSIFQNFNLEEMTAALFTLYATIFFTSFLKSHSYISLLFAGLLVGCALMGKQVTIGIIPSFLLAYIISVGIQKKNIQSFGKAMLFFSVGIFLGVIPFITYFYLHNALGDFLYWNIVFNLTVYPQQSTAYALKDGIVSSFWLYVAIVPAVYLFFKTKNKDEKILLPVLILNSLFLFPSFFPSFLVYKMLPLYAYPLMLWVLLLEYRRIKVFLFFILIGLIAYLPLAKNFYVDYVPTDIFRGNYILDYGSDELSVVEWLKTNTRKDERIMNLGHHYMTTLAKRLPSNRYVYIFPWLVTPFEKSTSEIIASSPRVVVVDTKTISDWPVLKNWGFLSYIAKNYKRVETYGVYEIYVKSI